FGRRRLEISSGPMTEWLGVWARTFAHPFAIRISSVKGVTAICFSGARCICSGGATEAWSKEVNSTSLQRSIPGDISPIHAKTVQLCNIKAEENSIPIQKASIVARQC